MATFRFPLFSHVTVLAALLLATAVGCAESPDSPSDADIASDTESDTGLDVSTEDADVGSSDTDPDSTPDICTPDCGGKQCGADGCGGTCGTCTGDTFCSSEGLCTATPGDVPLGGFCGATAECAPLIANESGELVPNGLWPACLDAQCESSLCFAPYCSQPCVQFDDQVNNDTGQSIPDGVEDPQFDTCGDAFDGPMGDSLRCVNFAPFGEPASSFCVAGTTFGFCASTADCPDGEVCDLIDIFSTTSPRCIAAVQEGAAIGGACESQAAAEPADVCTTPSLCTEVGCSTICGADEECITAGATCVDGSCGEDSGLDCDSDADCSGWVCIENPVLGEDGLAACGPRGCERNNDCRDPDFLCHPRPASGGGGAAWAHQCIERSESANAELGQACTNDPDSGVICPVSELCYKGQCAALCLSDGDCADEAGQVCAVVEVPVDSDGDGSSVPLPLSVCEPLVHAGPLTECGSDADCTEPEEVCAPIQFAASDEEADFAFSIERYCRAMPSSFGEYGDPCGTAPGDGECKLGICINDDVDQVFDPLCSAACSTRTDCPSVELNGTTYPSVCRSITYGQATSDGGFDDLFTPVCWPVAAGSSLEDCAETLACRAAGEACVAWVVAEGPTDFPTVEYLCTRAPSEVREPAPLGASCGKNADCASLLCLPGQDGESFCGSLCNPDNADGDCIEGGPTFVCDPHRAIDRPLSAFDAVIHQCRKAESCIPCERDADCTSGMACVTLAGQSICAWTCDSDEDCELTDGGSNCIPSNGVSGEEVETCRPQACN